MMDSGDISAAARQHLRLCVDQYMAKTTSSLRIIEVHRKYLNALRPPGQHGHATLSVLIKLWIVDYLRQGILNRKRTLEI